jgi:hypothetical protein
MRGDDNQVLAPTRPDLFANAAFHIPQKRFMVPRALSSAKGNN